MGNLKREFYKKDNTILSLSETLESLITNDTVIVCIGTDKVVGDSLGPLVGTMLKNSGCIYPIYGTLDSPVHALNIHDTIAKINKEYPKSNILSIDACVGKTVGEIVIRDEPISPGKGAGKQLPDIGNHSIVGIVDTSYCTNNLLKNIRLGFILKMSEIIATSIILAIDKNKEVNSNG